LLPILELVVITEQKKLHPTILNCIKNSQLCGNIEYGMFSQFPQERRSSLSLEAFKQMKATLNRYFIQEISPEWRAEPMVL